MAAGRLSNEDRRLLEHRKRLRPDAKRVMFPQRGEEGWAKIPRTLPVLLRVLGDERLSGSMDPSRVYVDIFCRVRDVGLIEFESEKEHAFACGYDSRPRSWRERVRKLQELGFIEVYPSSASDFGWALVIHPDIAMKRLRDRGDIDERTWNAYEEAKIRFRSTDVDDPEAEEGPNEKPAAQ